MDREFPSYDLITIWSDKHCLPFIRKNLFRPWFDFEKCQSAVWKLIRLNLAVITIVATAWLMILFVAHSMKQVNGLHFAAFSSGTRSRILQMHLICILSQGTNKLNFL